MRYWRNFLLGLWNWRLQVIYLSPGRVHRTVGSCLPYCSFCCWVQTGRVSDVSRSLHWTVVLLQEARASAGDTCHGVYGLSSVLTLRFPRLHLPGWLMFTGIRASKEWDFNYTTEIDVGRGPILLLPGLLSINHPYSCGCHSLPRTSKFLGSPTTNDRIWSSTMILGSLLPNSRVILSW